MIYALKLMLASAAALAVAALAIAYTPWGVVGNSHDVVLFFYLGLIVVALPGLTWAGVMRLMGML